MLGGAVGGSSSSTRGPAGDGSSNRAAAIITSLLWSETGARARTVARPPGLFVGVAFHSGGFAYDPASGFLLAESVADGRTSLDGSAFSPDRFTPEETNACLAEALPQRSVVRRRH